MLQEGDADTITLKDDDPDAIRAMLEHCYSRNYKNVVERYQGDKGLLFHAHMLAVADKYQVASLLSDVEDEITKALQLSINDLRKARIYEAFDFIFEHLGNAECSTFVLSLPEILGNTLFTLAVEDTFNALMFKHGSLAYACSRVVFSVGHPRTDAHGKDVCPSRKRSFTIIGYGNQSEDQVLNCPWCSQGCGDCRYYRSKSSFKSNMKLDVEQRQEAAIFVQERT